MAFDLSWLWNLLNGIVTTMQSWFSSLWSQISSITNTGQGLFAGLVAFGSQLWDAILKGVTTFGEWLSKSLKWLYDGLVEFAKTFGQWLNTAFSWIGSSITWVAQQLYNFANWLYNSIIWIGDMMINTLSSAWNALVSWFSGMASAIGSWWASVIGGINTWYTNLLKGFRTKIVQTIMADITIAGAWKGAERIMNPSKMSDMGYGLLGIIASPIVGRVVGEIVNAVVPLPSSATYPLIPDISGFTYTPPSISIPRPSEKTPPTLGAPLYPFGYFVGVWEITAKVELTYDVGWVTPAQKEVSIGLTHEESQASSDGQAQISLTYETVVA